MPNDAPSWLSIPSLSVGLATGIILGYIASRRRLIRQLVSLQSQLQQPPPSSHSTVNMASSFDISEFKENLHSEFRLTIIMRTDLALGKGKAAAQCCHAALKAHRQLEKSGAQGREVLQMWRADGEAKVVLKVSSEEELLALAEQARQQRLPVSLIADAGRTQIASGTLTVAGIGPAPKSLIDRVTGHLKLY